MSTVDHPIETGWGAHAETHPHTVQCYVPALGAQFSIRAQTWQQFGEDEPVEEIAIYLSDSKFIRAIRVITPDGATHRFPDEVCDLYPEPEEEQAERMRKRWLRDLQYLYSDEDLRQQLEWSKDSEGETADIQAEIARRAEAGA
jgi:hypothetical protein